MSCGCTSACGCNVVGDHVTAEVARDVDTFTVSAIHPIRGVEDTDCIDLVIREEDRYLLASPILADAAVQEASVQLRCSQDGIVGDVRLDPASTAVVSTSSMGLRVDMPPIPAADGEGQPGDILFFMGIGERVNYQDADGGELQRDEFPALFDALTLAGTAAEWTTGSDIIDGVPSAYLLGPGIVIECAGFVPGTTIVQVMSVSQIRVSTTALDTGVGELRAYPHGDGDGFSSFNKPNMNRRLPMGRDPNASLGSSAIGTLSGALDVAIAEANLPAHTHGSAIVGSISVSTAISGAGNVNFDAIGNTDLSPAHVHDTATAGRSFLEVDTDSITHAGMEFAGGDDFSVTIGDSTSGPAPLGQLNDGGTASAGAHAHDVSVAGAIAGAAIAGALSAVSTVTEDLGVAIDPAGSGQPLALPAPPHAVGRWMVHV